MLVWVGLGVEVRAIVAAVVLMTWGCASAVDEPAASTAAPPPVGAPPASSGFTPEQTEFLRWTVREAVEDLPTRGDLRVLEQRLELKIERESNNLIGWFVGTALAGAGVIAAIFFGAAAIGGRTRRTIACAFIVASATLAMRCAHGQPGTGEQPPRLAQPPAGQTSVFKDCADCPEMVALPGADVAIGRYEVTMGEFRAFAEAVPEVGDEAYCGRRPWWRPWGYSGTSPTERHPVACVSWNQAQAYLRWLSLETGQEYRLPTGAEWDRGAAGSPMGCFFRIRNEPGACAVGGYAPSDAGLFDMVGNLWEWTTDCWDGDCDRKVLRGASFRSPSSELNPDARTWARPEHNDTRVGFRVARTLP